MSYILLFFRFLHYFELLDQLTPQFVLYYFKISVNVVENMTQVDKYVL